MVMCVYMLVRIYTLHTRTPYINIYIPYLERTVAQHIVYILHKWFVNMGNYCLHFILTVAVKPYKQASLAPSLICVIPYCFF
jgi:hypothetical protein